MKNKDHDYSVFLALIAIWMMLSCFAQCESARNMNDIKRELSDIRFELNLIRHFK